MAQYLDLNPAQASKNDRVAFTDISLVGDFLIRCRCELYNHTTVPAGMLFSGGNSGGGVEIYRNGSLGVQLFINGTSVGTAGNLWPYTNGVDINPRYVDLRRVGSTLTVEFDGAVAITVSNSATLKINSIGSRGTGFYLGFKLYDLEITNGAFYRKYDASLAGSTGTVLATNDGVNQGTISGGAAYVTYEGGDPEPSADPSVSVSSSVLLPTSTVSLDNTVPQYSANITSIAGLPTSSVAIDNIVPEFILGVSSVCPIPTSTVSLNNEVPSNTLNCSSFTLLPVSTVVLSNTVPEYTAGITSIVGLPTSSVSLTPQQVGEYSLSVVSVAPTPTSTVSLTAVAPNGTTIGSICPLPTSSVVLDSVRDNRISVVSNAPIPTSTTVLEYEYIAANIISVIGLPTSSVVLDNDVPEYTLNVSSSVLLPTSNIFLINGELIKHINSKNVVTLKYQPNSTTIKTPNNIIKLRN